MSIDVNVQNDLVIVTESSEDITVNVSNAAGPAGVGVPVGGTTGQVLKKLSNTNYDTYWALDGGGVPYSGATGDVDLGEYELKAGQVEFDQTPTGTAGVGVMRWNDSDGTIDLGLKGGNVTLQVGQELVQRVVNKSGINLLEANYQVVRVSDAQGQRLAVQLAQGNNDANSTDTIGIVTETINNNQEGFVTTSGLVRNINTTGSLQGETWIDGDVLYLSPTVAGRITKVKPTAPNHSVILGYVVYAHAVNGKIFVKVDNGYEIGELHDVYVPTPSNNDGIFWNTANSRYQNNTIAGALGFTPISGSGATGQVAYWNGTSSQTGSNNLFWDAANSRLGIGTNAPSAYGHINQAVSNINDTVHGLRVTTNAYNSTGRHLYLENIGSTYFYSIGGLNGAVLTINSNLAQQLQYSGTTTAQFGTYYDGTEFSTNAIIARTNSDIAATIIGKSGQTADLLSIKLHSSGSYLMKLKATGNLLLGTTTDGGQRLQVQGDAFIKGSGSIALEIQNSSGVSLAQFRSDTRLTLGGKIDIGLTNTAFNAYSNSLNILGIIPSASWATEGTGIWVFDRAATSTSGTLRQIRFGGIGSGFAPTSGTATHTHVEIQSTINQTGGANGITRGLYVNPTLTAAADWRSIEWSNNSGWGLYGAGTANNYLGGNLAIGTTTPNASGVLHIDKSQNTLTSAFVTNSNTGTGAQAGIRAGLNPSNFGIDYISISILGTNFGTTGILKAKSGLIENFGSNLVISNYNNSEPIIFATTTSRTERMRLTAAGRLLLGTTSEGSEILKVQGTTSLNGGTSVTGSVTATSANGRGVFVQQTLVASANGDFLTGLLVQPTFNTGAFTGVSTLAARFDGTVYVNGSLAVENKLLLSAGTTARSQINLASSTAPTSPNNGDIWFDGTDLKIRVGGLTRTIVLL